MMVAQGALRASHLDASKGRPRNTESQCCTRENLIALLRSRAHPTQSAAAGGLVVWPAAHLAGVVEVRTLRDSKYASSARKWYEAKANGWPQRQPSAPPSAKYHCGHHYDSLHSNKLLLYYYQC